VSIPVFPAAKVLCGTTYSQATDWRNCQSNEKIPELRDAVVVFGDHVGDNDWHQEGKGKRVYGVDLQANFVAAILDKRCYLPLLSAESNLLFIGATLLILHICFHFFKPLWRTLLIAVVVWGAIVAASFVILSFTGYLFTIWVQGITLTTIFVTALHHWSPAHE
jgi:CHASE2 domain-containing sensor protein